MRSYNSGELWPLPHELPVILLSTSPQANSADQPIRTDALELVFSTLVMLGISEVRFKHQRIASTQSVNIVSLNLIRRRILRFLGTLVALLSSDSNIQPCPTLWMDEQCRIECATLQSDGRCRDLIGNREPDWTPPRTSNRQEGLYYSHGYFDWLARRIRADSLEQDTAELVAQDAGVKEAWESLRDAEPFFRTIMQERRLPGYAD